MSWPMYVTRWVAPTCTSACISACGCEHAELARDLVGRVDELLRIGVGELAEADVVDVERQILRDERQARRDVVRERDRARTIVVEIERELEVRLAEQLDLEADANAALVRVVEELLGIRLPRREPIRRGQDVVERGPLDVVAAVLDHPIDDRVRVARITGLPEREVRLDRMERVELEPAHADLRRVRPARGAVIRDSQARTGCTGRTDGETGSPDARAQRRRRTARRARHARGPSSACGADHGSTPIALGGYRMRRR